MRFGECQDESILMEKQKIMLFKPWNLVETEVYLVEMILHLRKQTIV